MDVLLATHTSSLRHDTGPRHPERPARVGAVVAGVNSAGVQVQTVEPGLIDLDVLAAVHDPDYISAIERFCSAGGGAIDLDTYAGPESWEAALRAAAAGIELSELLISGRGNLGYVAMRPPGHHAIVDQAMGFCLFNNAAITARYLADRGARVAVVDWDVHHGNGTQDLFYEDDAVLYLSIHEAGIYPGTGRRTEVGSGRGTGFNINVPVPGGTGGWLHRTAVSELFVPVIEQFGADWLLVSAGYDAHESDPLARLRLTSDDYGAMAAALRSAVPSNRTIVFLEGGYDLDALTESAAATVKGWLRPEWRAGDVILGGRAEDHLRHATSVAAAHWRVT